MFDDFLIKRFSFDNILWGFIIGFLLFIYPAAVFYILAVIIISLFLYKKLDKDERSFILYIFYSALFLRLALIIVTHILSSYYGFGPKSPTFPGMEGGAIIGDDIGIHARAWALANMVKGAQLPEKQTRVLLNFGEYGWSLHVYILGIFYYLLGVVPILGKCINALFGVLTGILVYFISKELFGIKTAKLACILTLFYPTLFLWSISNLKDTLLIFILTFVVFCYIAFTKLRRAGYLLLLSLSFFLLAFYRLDAALILISIIIFFFVISIKWDYKRIVVAGIIGFFFLISGNIYNYCPSRIKNKIILNNLISNQKGHVGSGNSGYKIYPERFYEGNYKNAYPINIAEFTISLAKGFLSLFFRPFPWEIHNIYMVFYYPVSIIHIILLFFFVFGSLISLRYHMKQVNFLLLLSLIMLLSLSLSEGNVGTMIRHRDMVTPIYIIFSSFGIVQLLSRLKFRNKEWL